MNETETNAQRIMTELLAAHAQTKRMLAENLELMDRAAELDKLVGQQRMRIGAVDFENASLMDRLKSMSRDIQDLRAHAAIIEIKNAKLRVAPHNLVEACFKADNNGELAEEIDGSLMDAAWEVLK